MQEVKTAFDVGYDFVLTCYDLTKTFDSVDHNLLLDKLDFYGIRGAAHKLLQPYLTEKEQITIHEDTSWEPIKIGKKRSTGICVRALTLPIHQ